MILLSNESRCSSIEKSLEQYRGISPNYDDHFCFHTGDCHMEGTNHYYFDLNRDWFYLSKGLMFGINEWRLQILMVLQDVVYEIKENQ